MLTALAAASLVGCGLFQPQPAEQQQEAKGLTTPRDILLHGIVAGRTFQSNQGFTLQNGSSLHANSGLILNSRNIVTNGGQVSSTSSATCSDNSGLGFCVNGKPKTLAPIVVIPKPDITAIRNKYSQTSTNIIQGTLNLNSSSDISTRFDNKITQIKGSLNLNTLATIKNATIIVDETLNSNQGMTLENSRIIVKQVQLNQTTTLTNSRIISSEDLTVNGRLENNQNSSLVSSKNITTNQAVNSLTGELAMIANLNITTNQSPTGKISLWAGNNITTNQSSRLEGSITAGGAIRFNQAVNLTRVLQHSNGDVLGGGEIPYGTREEGILQNGQSWKSTIFGVEIIAPKNETIRLPATVSVESVDPAVIPIPLPYPTSMVTFYRIKSEKELISSEGIRYKFPIPSGENLQDYTVAILNVNAPTLDPDLRGKVYWTDATEYLDSERVLSTKTSILSKEGFIFALVKFTTPVKVNSQTRIALQAITDFQISCNPRIGPSICPTTSDTSQIVQILTQAMVRYRRSMGILATEEAQLSKTIFIRESGKAGSICQNPLANALYNIRDQNIFLCLESNGALKSEYQRTLVHELYHAIQFIYLKALDTQETLDNWGWLIEGTAVSAEKSDTTMKSTSRAGLILPQGSRTITKKFIESDVATQVYEMQDFWVFAGLKIEKGLVYQKELFELIRSQQNSNVNLNLPMYVRYSLVAVVNQFFVNNNTNLKNLYWQWSKNQGIEKSENFRNWAVRDLCRPDSIIMRPDYSFNSSGIFQGNEIIQPLTSSDKKVLASATFKSQADIAPLETRVVRVRFAETGDLTASQNQVPLLFKVTKPDGSVVDKNRIRYKWYLHQPPKTLSSGCGRIEDNELLYRPSKESASDPDPEIVVLISNVNLDAANTIDRTTGLEQVQVSVQRLVADLETIQPSVALNGQAGETVSQTVNLKNKGDTLSEMAFRSYAISAESVLVLTSGQFPQPPRVDARFNNAGSTSAEGVLAIPEPRDTNAASNIKTVRVSYTCPDAGANFSSGFEVAYRTNRLLPDKNLEVLIAKVPITVNCTPKMTSLSLLSQPIKETIEGYTDEGGTFVYESRFVTTVVKNNSTQTVQYKAKSQAPFNKVLREAREAPADSRDFVDVLLNCPNGAGSYSGTTDLVSNDPTPAVYAVVPVDLECKETPKPTLTPAEAQRPAIGGAHSDPHLFTFDGTHYEGQKAGEFILAKSLLSDGFQIQARFEDVFDSQIWSATTAVAMRLEGYRIAIYLKNGTWRFRVNGAEVFLTNNVYAVSGEIKLHQSSNGIDVSSATGYSIRLGTYGTTVDMLEVQIPSRSRGQVRGLLGDADGNQLNDFKLRNGLQAKSPITIAGLLDFLESWRIGLSESLFDYEIGESTTKFNDFTFPQNKSYFEMFGVTAIPFPPMIMLAPEPRAIAEDICKTAKITTPAIFRNCVFDVGLTGDEIWARVAERIDPANLFVAIIPEQIEIYPSDTTSLQAFATHKKAVSELVWSTTGGTLTPASDEVIQYTAPTNFGTYKIRASLAEDPTVFDEIVVKVSVDTPNTINWNFADSILLATATRTATWNPITTMIETLSVGRNLVAAITRDGAKWVVNNGVSLQIQNAQGLVCELTDNSVGIQSVNLNTDDRIVIGVGQTTIFAWELSTCHLLWQKSESPQSISVANNIFAYLESDMIGGVNLQTGVLEWELRPDFYASVAIALHPLETQIAVFRPGMGIILFSTATREQIGAISTTLYNGTRLQYSPDGTKILLFSSQESVVYNVASGQHIVTLQHSSATVSVWNPTSSSIAVLEDGSIRIYDATTGQRKQSLNF
jgi:hypothetical protein